MSGSKEVFEKRMQKHKDELKWLYTELYQNDAMFEELCKEMQAFYLNRRDKLKERDLYRESDQDWFRRRDMLGMMLYIDNFGGTIRGVQDQLDYLKECNVNCIHLMPFLDSPEGHSDGGYAVSDFRKVKPELGTMEELSEFTGECHHQNINVCMDFVMNHTSDEHEWAKRARNGEGEYMSRYFFYDNPEIPNHYDETVPQVFPTTAPGNFTWLPEISHYVLTSFYPYQWDLNYKNPRVFNEMMYNFLYLANQGIDIIRIDAVPYIWKELGTDCRNLMQVHTIIRMMRMIGEIVCPGVVLLGEVVMEPDKVVPYFGTVSKPECHMLYNVATMAATWNSVATRDTRLLKHQMDIVGWLPKKYTFLNYLRCHDDIGWGLDYSTLQKWGMEEASHKRYLNAFFTGRLADAESRGELYNDDPLTQDARFCGTTASMCGIESAGFEQDDEKMTRAIRMDLMLHAYMLTQSGIPMIYSGDEIGQVNDYSYKEDIMKSDDSRYLHRGKFNWENAARRNDIQTVEGKMFGGLKQLADIRRQEAAFDDRADVYTYDVKDSSLLCILRMMGRDVLFGIFNFSEQDRTAWMEEKGIYENLITGEKTDMHNPVIPGQSFIWMKRAANK